MTKTKKPKHAVFSLPLNLSFYKFAKGECTRSLECAEGSEKTFWEKRLGRLERRWKRLSAEAEEAPVLAKKPTAKAVRVLKPKPESKVVPVEQDPVA